MTTYAVDASVAGKWLLPAAGEAYVDQANHLLALHVRHDLQLVAPDLIWSELGNILWKAMRRGRIQAGDAERSLKHFLDLAIQVVPAADLLVPTMQIATQFDRTFYDSLYVALAMSAKCELVTADERLVNALASRLPVRWLGAY